MGRLNDWISFTTLLDNKISIDFTLFNLWWNRCCHSWSFVQRHIVASKSTSKSSSENLSNHNKQKPIFPNTFVFKTTCELRCQNELFFSISSNQKSLFWLLRFSDEFFDTIMIINWRCRKLLLMVQLRTSCISNRSDFKEHEI